MRRLSRDLKFSSAMSTDAVFIILGSLRGLQKRLSQIANTNDFVRKSIERSVEC